MDTRFVVFAIPLFLILIFIEIFINKGRNGRGFRFNDSINNLSIGIGEQVVSVFSKAILVMMYSYLYDNYRFYAIPNNILSGIVLLFLFDFCFYWAHRLGHEVNIFWAGHIVHHSSEEYNLTVALRQPWFYSLMSFFLFFPLALMGFSKELFIIIGAIDILYQFWIHTKLIGKLGFLEYFLNTPSHHRVHHGINPQYVDKNYAGMFIIWDKMFGTFEDEKEEVVYGVTSPIKSWNPSWANVHYYFDLFKLSNSFRTLKDKIQLLFMPPGWKPAYLGGREFPKKVSTASYHKFDKSYPARINYYVLAQFIILVICSVLYIFFESEFDTWKSYLMAAYFIFSFSSITSLFEMKKWTFRSEVIRNILFPLIIFLTPIGFYIQIIVLLLIIALSIFFIIWFKRIHSHP